MTNKNTKTTATVNATLEMARAYHEKCTPKKVTAKNIKKGVDVRKELVTKDAVKRGKLLDLQLEDDKYKTAFEFLLDCGYDVKRCNFCKARHLVYHGKRVVMLVHIKRDGFRIQTREKYLPAKTEFYKISGYSLDTIPTVKTDLLTFFKKCAVNFD